MVLQLDARFAELVLGALSLRLIEAASEAGEDARWLLQVWTGRYDHVVKGAAGRYRFAARPELQGALGRVAAWQTARTRGWRGLAVFIQGRETSALAKLV